MTKTLAEQANAIAEGTNQFVMINEGLRNLFRNVVLLAALAFEDDGSLTMDGDIAAVEKMDVRAWPYVATQLEIGLSHSGLAPELRAQWETAIKAVARIARQDFPVTRDGIDEFIPF